MTDFVPYPKTPRLRREVVITEKIDGTNAGIQIIDVGPTGDNQPTDGDAGVADFGRAKVIAFGGRLFFVYCQSRKRVITPGVDNHGFATWVWENAYSLVGTLGEGVHFGEWWGSGIQRGYGLEKGEKRFSLFNVGRWADADLSAVPGLGVVPTLDIGVLNDEAIDHCLHILRTLGSYAAPGFMNPEGIIVFHTQSRQVYKVLLENDEVPKGLVA